MGGARPQSPTRGRAGLSGAQAAAVLPPAGLARPRSWGQSLIPFLNWDRGAAGR